MRDPSMERARSMLGCLAKDKVTGFTGLVTAAVEHAYGCAHVVLEPETVGQKNERMKGAGFDEARVEILEHRKLNVTIAEPKYKVGNILEDAVNGQQGMVSSITTWLFTCPDYALEPVQLKPDGSVDDVYYLPEARAKLIEASVPPVVPYEKPEPARKSGKPRTGGPRSTVPDHRRGLNL